MNDYIRTTRRPLRWYVRRVLLADTTEIACGVLIMAGVMGWAAWLPGW